MKVKDIYELAIEMGQKADPRGIAEIERCLEANKKDYAELPAKKKQYFDLENLRNPYMDSRILAGDENSEVKTVMAGIDLEVGEILLADRLREKGQQIDLLLAHHPEGVALASLAQVMGLQSGYMAKYGVLANVAEAMMAPRMDEVKLSLSGNNHNRSVDAAKLLHFPFMCVHTPADNLVTDYLHQMFDRQKPHTVGDIMDNLSEIPEYQMASGYNAGPRILAGDTKNTAGKIYVDFTGGASGTTEMMEKLVLGGVSTIVCMHIEDKHLEAAKKVYLNVVLAGHISSDSLGLNLFLDRLEANGIRIIPASGLLRYSRKETM